MITMAMCLAGRDLSEPNPSPDGSLVLVGVRDSGRSVLVLVSTAGGPERALACDPAPASGRGLGGGCTCWLPDSSGFVYVAVDGQIWLHRLDGHQRQVTSVPDDRSVTGPVVSPDGRRLAYVVDLAEVHVLDLDSGEDRVVSRGFDFVIDPAWHPDSSSLVWSAWSAPHMAWDQSVVATLGGLAAGVADVQMQQPRFGPDGALWTLRDSTGWLNLWRNDEVRVDEPFEHGGPTWGPGQRSYAVSPDGRRVAFTRNERGFGRLCVVDAETGDVREVAKGVHGQLSWVGFSVVALRSGAKTPTQVVVYDTRSWERRVLMVGPTGEWDRVGLTEPVLVECAADDGSVVHARCYRPEHPSAQPETRARLICWLHGGPTDQWTVGFLPRVAYWVAQGWTVLVPDHRGSTGHGRQYQQALHGRWGELDTADVAATIRHAHAEGWGHADTTVLMGGSAGGFTALNVLAAHPELVVAAAIAYPVTDLVALDEGTHRFEAHYNATLVGPRPLGDHAARDRYRSRSPIAHVTSIRRPLLILHGESDPVVPLTQTIEFVERVRSAGGHVELHVYPGEGHGFRQPSTQADEYARIGAFIARAVGPG